MPLLLVVTSSGSVPDSVRSLTPTGLVSSPRSPGAVYSFATTWLPAMARLQTTKRIMDMITMEAFPDDKEL